MNNYTLYDNIIKATYINIGTLSFPKKIPFNNFNWDNYTHKVFLQISFMVADFERRKIYLNCKLFDFFKILFHYYNIKEIIMGKCKIRFRGRPRSEGIDIEEIAAFEVKAFETTVGIFEEIWKEYYQKGE